MIDMLHEFEKMIGGKCQKKRIWDQKITTARKMINKIVQTFE